MQVSTGDVTEAIAFFLSIFNLAAIIYVGGWRLGQLTLKVNTMWDFVMRRATIEGLDKGVVTKNSPIMITKEAKEAFCEIEPNLIDLRKKYPKMSDNDLALLIERKHGEWIVDNICRKLRLYMGACLVVAVLIANGEPVVPST